MKIFKNLLCILASVLQVSLIDGAGEISYADFGDIGCNKDINSCNSWTGSSLSLTEKNKVTIPCGDCISLGEFTNGETIDLTSGIDIQGTLLIPEGSKLTILTPFITVQGKLAIYSNAKIDGEEDIKIILKGTDDLQFIPVNANAAGCKDTTQGNTIYCDFGKKVIAVAGGTIDIKAIPDTCPTWVSLLDNVVANFPIPSNPMQNSIPPLGCNAIAYYEDFISGTSGFRSSPGSTISVSSSNSHDGSQYLVSSERLATWQGPSIDLKKFNVSDCINSDTNYLFSFRARLTNNGTESNCYSKGTDCLTVKINSIDSLGTGYWKTLFDMPPSSGAPDGEWFSVSGTLNFAQTLDNSHLYQLFYICGPEAGIDIAIDDLEILLPNFNIPEPNQQCLDLVVNGDAEFSPVHTYPFELFANAEASLDIRTEQNGNRHFKVTGRNKTWASLDVPLPTDCIEEFAVYNTSAKIWIQSDEPTMVTMAIKRQDPTNDKKFIVRTIGKCDYSSRTIGWITCSRPYMITKDYVGNNAVSFFLRSDDAVSDLWVDDISIELIKTPVNSIIVDASVAECWNVGAEIVTTSHTLSKDDAVTSKITGISVSDGKATITLNNTMEWHTTKAESAQTAVEVALLSRNVLFTHAHDDVANPFHGGHFMIVQTPNVPQMLQGVEMRNMGQQGNLGRYPIHYHLSTENPGSLIWGNTIRHSNQRCVVIHNTHNTTVSWNVAYDTFGHCFMTEDGLEKGNLFAQNIGVLTKKVPAEGLLSIAESDNFASTFWISSPTNFFEGNVAAGGEDTGFWYEFLDTVRGISYSWDQNYTINPSAATYGYNVGTVCHSNQGDGFKLYPNGYFPEEEAAFKDFRSYLNKGDGILLHNSANLAVEGGYFADNRQGVEIDKQADAVRVSNAHFVGFSQLFMDISTASVKQTHCPAKRALVGIQLHSYLRYRDSRGYLIENNTFEMFGETLTKCAGSTAMNIDSQVRDTPPHYDAYATFKHNTYETGIPMSEKFDACGISYAGVKDMAINDESGDLNPINDNTPGFVVSNSSLMTAFVSGDCHDMSGSCALYCENACFRTVNFAVPLDESMSEAVIKATNQDGTSQDFTSYFEYVLNDDETANSTLDNFVYVRRRFFSVILPYGIYTLQFYKNNTPFFPKFAEMVFDDKPDCSPYIDNTTVTFVIPEPRDDDCFNLIKNSGLEDGNYDHWQHAGGDIMMTNPGYLSTRAVSTVSRSGAWHGLGQYIDMRCLAKGEHYEVTARFRMHDKAGNWFACDPTITAYSSQSVCPRVSMRLRTLLGDAIPDGVDTFYIYPVADTLAPVDANSWNFIYGILEITEDMVAATSIFVWVERYGSPYNMILDDFNIVPVVKTCNDTAFNRDVEAGDMRWWNIYGQTDVNIVSPGYDNSTYAIAAVNRKQFWASMAQVIKPECLKNGTAYAISAKIKLEKNGEPYDCDPAKYWGPQSFREKVCPTLAIRSDKGNQTTELFAGKVTGVWQSGEWNDIFGLFIATEALATADSMFAWFTKFSQNIDLIVDNLSVQPEPGYGCNLNIIHNSGAEYGDVRSWEPYYAGNVELWEGGADGSDYAVAYVGSKYWHEGLGQNIDASCLEIGVTYETFASVKLFEADKVTPYICDPTVKERFTDPWRCPVIAIANQNPGSFPTFTEVAEASSVWTADWNLLSGTFTFTSEQRNSNKVWIEIHNTKVGLVIVVDNFGLRKVQS